MSIIRKIARDILEGYGYVPKAAARRAYAAAVTNRLTADWILTNTSADKDIRDALESVRNRARELCQNESYARRYLSMCQMNIPGPEGFIFQSRAQEPNGTEDARAIQLIEEAFADWCEAENCTVSGTMSFREVQHLLIRHAARDGEFLAGKVINKKSKYGFQLQLLEPDLLDEKLNKRLDASTIIRMGVELDAWRRPMAYHLKRIDPELEVYVSNVSSLNWDRIPAEKIYHGYHAERAFQTRGVSWMAGVMWRLKMLQGWEEAGLVNARASAGKMGFLSNRPGEDGGSYVGDEADDDGNQITDVSPGVIEDIGDKVFSSFDPKFPEAQHSPYVKSQLRAIASGLDVSYNHLANDLEGVNFSSLRSGLDSERRAWKKAQAWFREKFLQPVFRDWLEVQLLNGTVNLPFAKLEKFKRHQWVGTGWSWVDPQAEAQASEVDIAHGWTSNSEIVAARGGDYEENLKKLAAEKKLREKYGIAEPAPPASGVKPKPDEEKPPEKEDAEEKSSEVIVTEHGELSLSQHKSNGGKK